MKRKKLIILWLSIFVVQIVQAVISEGWIATDSRSGYVGANPISVDSGVYMICEEATKEDGNKYSYQFEQAEIALYKRYNGPVADNANNLVYKQVHNQGGQMERYVYYYSDFGTEELSGAVRKPLRCRLYFIQVR